MLDNFGFIRLRDLLYGSGKWRYASRVTLFIGVPIVFLEIAVEPEILM